MIFNAPPNLSHSMTLRPPPPTLSCPRPPRTTPSLVLCPHWATSPGEPLPWRASFLRPLLLSLLTWTSSPPSCPGQPPHGHHPSVSSPGPPSFGHLLLWATSIGPPPNEPSLDNPSLGLHGLPMDKPTLLGQQGHLTPRAQPPRGLPPGPPTCRFEEQVRTSALRLLKLLNPSFITV